MSKAVMEVEETEIEPKVRKQRPPVIPTPRVDDVTGHKPIRIVIPIEPNTASYVDVPNDVDARKKPTRIWHAYVRLSDWIGRQAPDEVNPRSHDPQCLKSPVAKEIETTIRERPEVFFLANRGSTLLVDKVDMTKGVMTLTINDPENQGLADGATTDAVIAKVQTALARELLEDRETNYIQMMNRKDSEVPEILTKGRLHLEIIEGLEDRELIAELARGRNTSRQVKGWSLADFNGAFDFFKKEVEADGSEFKDKIGYDENTDKDVSVLDALSLLDLFHPSYDEKDESGADRAPTKAYSNKGKMDTRLMEENVLKGFKSILPLTSDIFKLHDYIIVNFEKAYDQAHKGKSRLGRRRGVEPVKMNLPLTGQVAEYRIPSGFVYPLLASFRALVSHKGKEVHWRVDPFAFFDKYGKGLVAELMVQVDANGGKPNSAGKERTVYTALYSKARNYLADELDSKR